MTPYAVHAPRLVELPLMSKVENALQKMVEKDFIVEVQNRQTNVQF